MIRNAWVLTINPDTHQADVLRNQDVLVNGNRIEAIQVSGRADPSHFDQVVEAKGQLVMPGLINTHAHVPMVLFRGIAEDVPIERWFNEYIWPLEINLLPNDVYWGMQLGAAEMIRAGITSVADHYFFMDRGAEALAMSGMRGLLGWAMFSSQGDPALDQAERFIRAYDGSANGRIRALMAPHAPYTCDDDFLTASARRAETLGVPLHIHAAETRQQTEASLARRGKTPIEVLNETGILRAGTIIAHACGVTPGDIELMADAGIVVATTPKTNMKLAMEVSPVTQFQSAGIPVGLGTDGAVSNNTLDIFEQMRLVALSQKNLTHNAEALTLGEAIGMATSEGARVMGMADDLGQIRPGFLADMILIDLTGLHHIPLHNVPASIVYSVQAGDVRTVIIDGEIVMLDGAIKTLDTDAIRQNITEAMERLAHRTEGRRIQTYRP
jgi:5-methylthioadenosine/S-adenosylhomocysteine deaminase